MSSATIQCWGQFSPNIWMGPLIIRKKDLLSTCTCFFFVNARLKSISWPGITIRSHIQWKYQPSVSISESLVHHPKHVPYNVILYALKTTWLNVKRSTQWFWRKLRSQSEVIFSESTNLPSVFQNHWYITPNMFPIMLYCMHWRLLDWMSRDLPNGSEENWDMYCKTCLSTSLSYLKKAPQILLSLWHQLCNLRKVEMTHLHYGRCHTKRRIAGASPINRDGPILVSHPGQT